ncbi:MAG: hypothetical protein WA144_12820 [Candidatus Methanoperedens sp.]
MTGKKEMMVYRNYLICTGIAFLLLIALSGISSAKTINIEKPNLLINLNKYSSYYLEEVKAGSTLNVEIQVMTGGDIDVLLMKPADFENYKTAITQRGTINYIPDGSLISERIKKYTYKFQDAGDYYLVLDNTDLPKGGGMPLDQIEMNLIVKVDPPSTSGSTTSESATQSSTQAQKTSGFEAILAAFAIAMLVLRKK